MPGTIIDMSKIKQVLQLSMNGISNRQIAKALSIDKETVNNYISKAKRETLSFKELIKLDDPVLERRFHFGNPAYSDERLQTFMELLPFFVEELSNKHVTRYNVWQNYREAYPNGYGRSQFFFHLGQNLEAKKKPSTVLYGSYNPGEKIFVDFAGDTLSYVNRDSGEIIKIQVFVASMPYTDYAFAMCVPSQKVEDFLYALRMCFEYLGGVPKIVVTDNLKSAVIKADKYEPTLNKALEDMGNHYGFVVIPCQPASPTQKALVENQVKLIYHRIYSKLRNRQFFSLQEINEAVWELLKAHNQTRMQQRTYSREEHFFSVEKGVLKPLPATPYQMRYYSDVTVQQNSHVYLSRDKHYYSVPYILIGRRAKIIYTNSIVKIFVNGEQVAVHPRIREYGFTTIKEHLASHSRAITERSPEYYKSRSKCLSEPLYTLISAIFDNTIASIPPEYYYRTCDMMLRLQKIYPANVFAQACGICIDNNIYSGKKLENIIKNLIHNSEQSSMSAPIPSGHVNMRGNNFFQ